MLEELMDWMMILAVAILVLALVGCLLGAALLALLVRGAGRP